MAPRQISSRLTALFKFVLPGILVLSLINVGIASIRGEFLGAPPGLPIFFQPYFQPLISAMLLLYTGWLFWPLKKVSIDEENLYVSNFRTVIIIPISEIDRVTEFILSEPRRVTVHLKTATDFGQKIVFLGTYRAFAFFSSHPVVTELRRQVTKT
jgi:hypothetical protein